MTKKINYNSFRSLVSNGIFRWAKNVFSIFLNVYLWKETNNLQLLALFNIVFIVWHIFWFFVSSFFVKLWYRYILNIISFFWLIMSYLLVIILWENFINNVYIVWFIFWIFNGSYYINCLITQFDLTTFKNRWNFEWIKKTINTISQIIFPWLIWFIIWIYSIKIAFFVWILFFIISFIFWNIKFNYSKWKTNYIEFFIKILYNKKLLYSLVWSFFYTLAFSSPLLDILIPLLIYNELKTEIKLWFSLSFLSFFSIIIIYLFWRIIDYKYYNKSLIIFCLLYIISLFWLIIFQNYPSLLFFSSMVISITSLYWISTLVITNNSLHSLKNYDDYKVEFTVMKEIAYSIWWVISFLLIYFSIDLWENSIKFILYSIMVFSVFSTLFLIKINIHEIQD